MLPALLTFSSCTKESRKADLTVLNGPEPASLDPALSIAPPDLRVVRELFEGLLRFDRFGKPQPGVASSWEISQDKKIYTFHLRPEAQWSHHLPVTADDFVYSWKRILSPKTGSSYRYALFLIEGAENFTNGKTTDFSTVGIEALNEHTLRVRLKKPTPYFLELCASGTFAPVPRALIESQGDDWIKPSRIEAEDNYSVISNGPYTISSWCANDKIVLTKNRFYWDEAHVAPNTIHVLLISNPDRAYDLYRSGRADLILDKGLLPSSLIESLSKKSDFHQAPTLESFFLRFNCYKEPFNDPRVRKAFALCVDRKLLAKRVPHEIGMITESIVPPGIDGYQSPPGIGYNPTLARQLLSEAGYPGGKNFPTISYLYPERELDRPVALELQSIWEKYLGVKIVLESQDWKTYLKSKYHIDNLDYGIVSCKWCADYADPNTFLDFFVSNEGSNFYRWSSPQYDRYLKESSTELDKVKRLALLNKAEALLIHDEMPVIPLLYLNGINLYDPKRLDGISNNILDIHPLYQMIPSW
jgi:oligopeptide transport system substrate-binding protein